jgi:capsule polysaccharide export protein KpsE/RkpR
MSDLTIVQIKKITDELVQLRKKLLANGSTALNPTAEWKALRTEIALLDKKLNADTKAKAKAKGAG